MSAEMVGRQVRAWDKPGVGVVVRWAPLGNCACDALVSFEGREIWYASYTLKPADSLGPLPSRQEARAVANAEMRKTLKEIRERHLAEFHKPWPGCEFGKVIIGNAIDDALKDLS